MPLFAAELWTDAAKHGCKFMAVGSERGMVRPIQEGAAADSRDIMMLWRLLLAVAVTPTAALAHDPYSSIFNFAGVNCCTGDDCRKAHDPSDFLPIRGGYRLKSTGETVPMPLTGFSPDDAWHVCRKSDRSIRCLLVPPGGA